MALLLFFVLTNNLLWSAVVPFAGDPYGAPDEIHHFEVPHYAFAHQRYPVFGVGRDLYIRVPPGLPDDIYHRVYGWYATNPWGAYLFGAATMFAVGWTSLAGTIYGARLSSVLMGVLVVYLAYLIARQLFPSRADLRLGVPLLIACIPQFTYVSAYFNADMFSVLCTTLVCYAWVLGLRNGFTGRTSLFLGLSLGLSALARMNCWIVVYPVSLALVLLSWRGNWRYFLARLVLVFLIPAGVFGIWFAYNVAVYGDPLAAQVFNQAWAQDRPHLVSYAAQGYNWLTFLLETPWLDWGFTSFWGRLGYLLVPLSPWYYAVILGFCLLAVVGLVRGLARHVRAQPGLGRSWRFQTLLLFAAVVILIVAASFLNSFYQDFQPQGRYLFTALVPIGTLLVLGLGHVTSTRPGQAVLWMAAALWLFVLQAASLCIYLVGLLVLGM